MPGDIREAEIAALETVSETQVIYSEKVQDRRVEIIDVKWITHDRQASRRAPLTFEDFKFAELLAFVDPARARG